MKAQLDPITVLGPVNELPAEGFKTNRELNPLEFYSSTLAQAGIGFDVSDEGVIQDRVFPDGVVFQEFDVGLDQVTNDPAFEPGEKAVTVDFDGLFRENGRFDNLSDAAEPRDYVRRFLESLGTALDKDSVSGFEGRHIPLIHWQPREGENAVGAQVQLIGILRANDEQFKLLCESEGGDFDLILEELEIEAHGAREMAMTMAILGISLAFAPQAEAGFFKKMAEKRRQARVERIQSRMVVQNTIAPVQVVKQENQTRNWVDNHRDARVDQELLAETKGKAVERRVVVDIGRQRAFLLIDGRIAIDTAISTARSSKHTPRGEFKITETVRDGKRSTIYGCEMPYWMRLDESAIGMHIGDLPGQPASAGCIRLPYSIAEFMFDNTGSGTVVQVVDSWDAAPASNTMYAGAN